MFSLPWSSKAPKAPEPPAAAAAEPAPTPVTPAPQADEFAPRPKPPVFSARSMKQLGLFFAGAGFFAFSAIVTRRSVARKITAAAPKFYHPSHRAPTKGENSEGSFIAFEALNLATLNVVSFAMMAAGGVAWSCDISSVDDLRAMARRKIGMAAGDIDEEAEKEVEEWVAKILKKEKKSEDGGGTDKPKIDK